MSAEQAPAVQRAYEAYARETHSHVPRWQNLSAAEQYAWQQAVNTIGEPLSGELAALDKKLARYETIADEIRSLAEYFG